MSIMYVKLRVSSYLQLVLEDLPRYTRDMSRVAILIEQCQASEPHIIHYLLVSTYEVELVRRVPTATSLSLLMLDTFYGQWNFWLFF